MSNYQRLISYIYTYEGGIKGKNIGFAKLETRGAQCRITVNVKKIFVGGNPIGVYLLSEKKEWRIGTLFARNGAGEFRATVNAADVESSGLGIEEFYGLSVHDVESTWRSYTTIWEDAVSHAAEVELSEVTAENARKKQPPEELEQEKREQNNLPIARSIEKALEQETPDTAPAAVPGTEPAAIRGTEPTAAPGAESAAVLKDGREPVYMEAKLMETETANVDLLDERAVKVKAEDTAAAEPAMAAERELRAAVQAQTEEGQSRPQPREIDLKRRHRGWSAASVRNLRESLMLDQAAVSAASAMSPAAERVTSESAPANYQSFDRSCGVGRELPQGPGPELPNLPQGPGPEPPNLPQGPGPELPNLPQGPGPELPNLPQNPGPELPSLPQNPGPELPNLPQNPGPELPNLPQNPGPELPSLPQNPGPELPSLPQNPPQGSHLPGQPGMNRVIRMPQSPSPAPSMGTAGRQPTNAQALQNRAGGRPLSRGNGSPAPAVDFTPGEREEQDSFTQEELWARLRKKYPKILAFDYADGCEVLTIKPQDIGLLPRETWLFGNNSFLLHGYYNFRYLILARLNQTNGTPRYLLGVPGHYYSNEKYMAGMFGFPDFVLAKKQQSGDGRFGYWYTDIKMGD